MIRQAVAEAKKPKNFFITLPKPASKKWELSTTKPESNFYEISLDEENWTINFSGKPTIHVYEKDGQIGIEWGHGWSWTDFASGAGKKIENMIKYFKEID